MPHKQRQRLHADLCNMERKVFGNTTAGDMLSQDDGEFLARAVWRLRSAIEPLDSVNLRGGLVLVRWQRDRPFHPRNVVLVTKPQKKRILECANREELVAEFGRDVVDRVDARLAQFF